jgi:alpha-1,3-rhamnosyl/mannosyltransferase
MHYVLDARTAIPHFPGIGRYVTNLAYALAPLLTGRERLTVLVDPQHPIVLPATPAVASYPVALSPFSLAQQWQIPHILGLMRADLYHSTYVVMPYAPGIPAVLTVYDLIPLLFPDQSSSRARLFARWANGLALHAAGLVLAISETTRADYIRHLGARPEKIVTVPLAADPAFAPGIDRQRLAAVAEKYALPERYVLYLGSNKPHKNLVRLVEAWSIVESKRQAASYKLVVAGTWAEQYPEARRRVEELELHDRVVFLGSVAEPDLPRLYGGAQLFVFPSLYEGFGLPVLEAMACGTPVVCSNRSSLPEVAGEAAILVDPLDVSALAGAIGRALSDEELRRDLRRRGLDQAQRFTWQETARRTLAYYRNRPLS